VCLLNRLCKGQCRMANTPPRLPAVDIKVIGGGPSGREAEYLSSWTNWVCNGACGKTSGRSIFHHAPLRATSSGSRRCIRWATRQTLGSMHLENVKAGSFCAWQETFTLSLQNSRFDAPDSYTRHRFCPLQKSVAGFKNSYKRPVVSQVSI